MSEVQRDKISRRLQSAPILATTILTSAPQQAAEQRPTGFIAEEGGKSGLSTFRGVSARDIRAD
jgi:hypothetical protein